MSLNILQPIVAQSDVVEFIKAWLELAVNALFGKIDAFTGGIVLLITVFFALYACAVICFTLLTALLFVLLLIRLIKLINQKRIAGYQWLICCLAVLLVGWSVWVGILSVQMLSEYEKLIELVIVFIATPVFSTAALLPCILLCSYLAFPSARPKDVDNKKSSVNVPAFVGLGLLMAILLAELIWMTVCPIASVGFVRFVVLAGNFGVVTIFAYVFAFWGIAKLVLKLIRKLIPQKHAEKQQDDIAD